MHFALIFDTKEELDEAAALLNARKGAAHPVSNDGQAALAGKLEAALAMSPLNQQRATVLKAWLAAPASEWVPFPAVVKAFVDGGVAPEESANGRASAAIRDLSWQVAQTLSQSELAGFDKAIEALASRSRAAGAYSYRLTPAGRIATERFLKGAEIA